MTGSNFSQATDLFGRAVRATNFLLDYWWLWLVLGAVAIVLLKLRSQHALIAQLDERADAAFGDVDALLVERAGLIRNLAETVRAYAQREHDVIRDTLEARVASLEALGNVTLADTQVAAVVQNLFSVSDQYPQLSSGEHYRSLRTDLIRIEEKITAARRFYNLAVEELNGVRRAFPGKVFARGETGPTREKFSLGERRAEFAEPVELKL